jgi:hypothetical protein
VAWPRPAVALGWLKSLRCWHLLVTPRKNEWPGSSQGNSSRCSSCCAQLAKQLRLCRAPSFTFSGMMGRVSPCFGVALPRSLLSSRWSGDQHGQLCRADLSSPDMSTSVVRSFVVRATGLPAESLFEVRLAKALRACGYNSYTRCVHRGHRGPSAKCGSGREMKESIHVFVIYQAKQRQYASYSDCQLVDVE